MPPPNVLLYGVFLLNQNISQLKQTIGIRRGDLRATLANLLDLMSTSVWEEISLQFTKNASIKQVENSMSSVESVPLNIINIPTSISSVSPRWVVRCDKLASFLKNFLLFLEFHVPWMTLMSSSKTLRHRSTHRLLLLRAPSRTEQTLIN